MAEVDIPLLVWPDGNCGYWASSGPDYMVVRNAATGNYAAIPGTGNWVYIAQYISMASFLLYRALITVDLTSLVPPTVIASAILKLPYSWVRATKRAITLHIVHGIGVPGDDSGYGEMGTRALSYGNLFIPLGSSGYADHEIAFNDLGVVLLNEYIGEKLQFGLRLDRDILAEAPEGPYEAQDAFFRASPDTNHAYLHLVYGAAPSFSGMFIRGNEIQAVFHPSRLYRSPDFGTTWYSCSGLPYSAVDVVFDKNDPTNSVVGCAGCVYTCSGAIGNVLMYEEGPAIDGSVTRMDVDVDSSVAIIGTTEAVYKTIDWGQNVYKWYDQPATGVAIGGNSISVSGE
jgi:hypothetical protein